MKTWMSGAMSLALTVAVAITTIGMASPAEAKRLGGGKSQGMQREMPARTAPEAPAGKPAQTPPAASPTAPATAGAVAAAAAPAKRSWMGPLAGLAAGLGLAALFSHFGMGGGLANVVMLALVVAAGFLLVRFLMARFGGGAARSPLLAGAPASNNGSLNVPLRANEPPMQRAMVDERPPEFRPAAQPVAPAAAAAAADTTSPRVTAAFVPASFDSDGFARTAKMIFIRMQTANDAADLDDLRRFTTPEMFAGIRLEIQERGGVAQTTDVQQVDAQVLDVAQEGERQIVSVRFRGRVLEDKGGQPTAFDEVWHLVKPVAANDAAWAIAGIEQMA